MLASIAAATTAAATTMTITTTVESLASATTTSSPVDTAAAASAAAACASRALYMASIDSILSVLLAMAFPFICILLTEGLVFLTTEDCKKRSVRCPPRNLGPTAPFSRARYDAEVDAEAAREDGVRFLSGSALLCTLGFALTTWAADLQAWRFCYNPRTMPLWILTIAWIVFAALTAYAMRALGAWVILARNLGGKPAKARFPLDDANWILNGVLEVLFWMPLRCAVEAIYWCQLHLCGRGKLPVEEVEITPVQLGRTERSGGEGYAESSSDGASTLYEIGEEVGEDERLLQDVEKAAA